MIRKIKEVAARMKIRKALQESPIEEVKITLEEAKKEYERRTKQHRKDANSSNN